jgi:hypothetical protein
MLKQKAEKREKEWLKNEEWNEEMVKNGSTNARRYHKRLGINQNYFLIWII